MLKYIGDGTQLRGVPTRDLTEKEVATFGRALLLSTGLYQEIPDKKKPPAADKKIDEVIKWPTA